MSSSDEEAEKPKKVKKARKPRKKKNPEHYVNPARLEQLITEYYESDVMSHELGESILKMATRIGFSSNFIGYSYREEMVGDALQKMLLTLDKKKYKFDPNKIGITGKPGNAFQYFSKVAWNAMVNRIKVEKKEATKMDTYRELMYDRKISEQSCGDMVKRSRPFDEEDTF